MDYKTIVVPYDFSEHADAALAVADDLAKRFGAELHLLHVIHIREFQSVWGGSFPLQAVSAEVREQAARALAEVATGRAVLAPRVHARIDEGSQVAERICERALELEADLLVMGTHGRTGLAHTFLGSTTERTLRTAPCPVLAVRARSAVNEGPSANSTELG